jgi:outer membrane protein assembly factor BamB
MRCFKGRLWRIRLQKNSSLQRKNNNQIQYLDGKSHPDILKAYTMKKRMLYLISIMHLLFSGCEKEPFPTPQPPLPDSQKLQIVWQKPVSADTLEYYVNMQDVLDNKLVYAVNLTTPTATIQSRSADDGNLKWIFSDFESPVGGFSSLHSIYVSNNNVMVNDMGDTYCIDAASGLKNWYSPAPFNFGTANMIGGFFYMNHRTGSYPNIMSSSLVRTKAQGSFSGWDTVYTRLALPDSFPSLNIPTLWINPQGDSILLFEDVDIYNGPPPTAGRYKSNITALNLLTRDIVWQYPDFKGYYNAPPLVDGDRLYINGPDVFCFDLNTGNLLWQKPFEGGVGGTSLVVHNDILVVQSSQIGMWGINKYTGDIIWYNKDTDGMTWELILFDGTVYCTSSGYGRLYAVNAETGATIWKEQSPNRKNPKTGNASFASAGVAIDPERRLLYTADKYYVMCIKLPEK